MSADAQRSIYGGASRRRLLLAVCLAAFMATLDTSIVNVALPQMGRDLGTSLADISWVVTAYLLVNVTLLLVSGRLADMLSPGRLFLSGMAIFALASAGCAAAPNLIWMVGLRLVQGVGAALMLGTAPKIIATLFGPGERGLSLGLFSTAFAAGISVGAPLGGFITAQWGWPFIFLINLPICGFALLVGRPLAGLAAACPWDRRAFDLAGSVLLAGGLTLLLLVLNRIRKGGWGDIISLGTLAGALVLFAALLVVERRQAEPLLSPQLWREPAFILGSVAVVLTFMAVMGSFFLMPFFFEEVWGYTPQQVGLLLVVLAGTNALVSPLGGFLADRWGNMLILRVGSATIVLGLLSLVWSGPANSTGDLAVRLALTGLGFGMFQAPNLNEVLRPLPPGLLGLAASSNSVLKNLGSLLGVSVMVLMFATSGASHRGLGPGICLGQDCFRQAFTFAAGLATLNLGVNLLPRRPRRVAGRLGGS